MHYLWSACQFCTFWLLSFVSLCRRNRRQLVCRATTRTYQPNNKPLIKICGITNPSDAEIAAKAGADFVGMIMWPKARRAVSIETAAKISETVRRSGAQPVAVFVDEDFADIVKTCKAAGIGMAQLHGKGSRQALQDLPAWLKVRSCHDCDAVFFSYWTLSKVLKFHNGFNQNSADPLELVLLLSLHLDCELRWSLLPCKFSHWGIKLSC